MFFLLFCAVQYDRKQNDVVVVIMHYMLNVWYIDNDLVESA